MILVLSPRLLDTYGSYLIREKYPDVQTTIFLRQDLAKLEHLLVPTEIEIGERKYLVHVPGIYGRETIDDLTITLAELQIDQDAALRAYLALPDVNAVTGDIMEDFHNQFIGTYRLWKTRSMNSPAWKTASKKSTSTRQNDTWSSITSALIMRPSLKRWRQGSTLSKMTLGNVEPMPSTSNDPTPDGTGVTVENRMIPPKNGLDSSDERSVNGDMSMTTFTPGSATTAPPAAADPFAAFTESFAPKRAVSYLRVSTREQAEHGGREEGFSIPAQRDANKKKATSMGAMVVKEFVERGVSGTSTNRPALQAMLRYLEEEAEHIDYVIVHKLDRLARNRADEVTLSTRFNELGLRLVSTSENIDQTPGGMLLQGIMSSIAEFYSRNLANEVLKGMNEKVRAGGTVSRAPIGYLNTRVIENGQESRTVTLDPERAPLVKWAFETYA